MVSDSVDTADSNEDFTFTCICVLIVSLFTFTCTFTCTGVLIVHVTCADARLSSDSDAVSDIATVSTLPTAVKLTGVDDISVASGDSPHQLPYHMMHEDNTSLERASYSDTEGLLAGACSFCICDTYFKKLHLTVTRLVSLFSLFICLGFIVIFMLNFSF